MRVYKNFSSIRGIPISSSPRTSFSFPSPCHVYIYIYIFVQHLPAAILIRNILIYNEIPQDYLVAHARHHKAWNVGDRPIV